MRGTRRLHHEELERRRLLAADCVSVPSETASLEAVEFRTREESLPLSISAQAENISIASVSSDGTNLLSGIYSPGHASMAKFLGNPNAPDLIQEVGDRLYVVDQDSYRPNEGQLYVYQRGGDGVLAEAARLPLDFRVHSMVVQDDHVTLVGKAGGILDLIHSQLSDTGVVAFPDGVLGLLGGPLGHELDVNADGVTDLFDLESALGVAVGEGAFQVAADWFSSFGDENTGDRDVIAQQFRHALDRNLDGLITPIDYLINAPHVAVVTVNLASVGRTDGEGSSERELSVSRMRLPGHLHSVAQDGDDIAIVANRSEFVSTVYPSPPSNATLYTLRPTEIGLQQVGEAIIPRPVKQAFVDGDFFGALTAYHPIHYLVPPGPDAPSHSSSIQINQFGQRDDRTRELAELDLPGGRLVDFYVAPDGSTGAVVHMSETAAGPETSVVLLDLAGDDIQVFETVAIPDLAEVFDVVFTPQAVVLRGNNNDVYVVDANQAHDVAAESRVKRVAFPADAELTDHLLINDSRLIIGANRIDLAVLPPMSHVFTVSIPAGEVIGDSTRVPFTDLPFVLIDPLSERFGLVPRTAPFEGLDSSLYSAQITGDGKVVVAESTIPVGPWDEIDATADRLIAREPNRIVEFDWKGSDPVEQPFDSDPPVITVVNDAYTLPADGTDHVLNVLDNDFVTSVNQHARPKITELIGAPDGVEIIGDAILVKARALEGVESLRFEYVAAYEGVQSSAIVEIDIREDANGVAALVDRIREQAAIDFDVDVGGIEIRVVESVFDEPLIVTLPNGDSVDLTPGILVTLNAPGSRALYAAGLDGQIFQVFSFAIETQVELGLRATDTNGDLITSVTEGDGFYIEFLATDLRELGLGVYSAFFDLSVPENLKLTGEIEYLDPFVGLAGSPITDQQVTDLGAFSSVVVNPRVPGAIMEQRLLRLGVSAVSAGEVTLRPDRSDGLGSEILLRGLNEVVDKNEVRYRPLSLTIDRAPVSESPHDTNGDGKVSPLDVLIVLNYLSENGAVTMEEVRADAGQADVEFNRIMKMDTNGSRTITPLDALRVINALSLQSREAQAEEIAALNDDDDAKHRHDESLGVLF